MATLPIAAQLYTVRDLMKEDFAGTVRAVAALGYEGVEFAGLYNTPAREVRALLDELGLKVSSSHVGFELDCGWVHKAGQDPLAWMRRLDGRLPVIHVKDVSADGDWAEVGQGAIPYGPIVAAAPGLGVEWLVVEQDTTRRPPLQSLG